MTYDLLLPTLNNNHYQPWPRNITNHDFFDHHCWASWGMIDNCWLVVLNKAAPTVDSMSMGLSCQPFSKGGDRRGGTDTRAYTLAWGLFICFMLKAPVMILECVSEAPGHQFVRQCIHIFQQITGFQMSERIMDIGGLWPSARKRWWCVLSHPGIDRVNLQPFPMLLNPPMDGDLMP